MLAREPQQGGDRQELGKRRAGVGYLLSCLFADFPLLSYYALPVAFGVIIHDRSP